MSQVSAEAVTPDTDWTRRVLGAGPPPGPSWQRRAYAAYRAHLLEPGFPCFFGQKAEISREMFYGFVANDQMSALLAIMRDFAGHLAEPALARHSLIMFFEENPAVVTHDQFAARFWEILQFLSDHDSGPPARSNPDDPLWEFSFMQVEMFVVATSATYSARRSRDIGPGMAMIFQPRILFQDPVTGAPLSMDLRRNIHRRMLAYDGMPVHPDVGVYGAPQNREWKQYVLPDDNEPTRGRCPLHRSR